MVKRLQMQISILNHTFSAKNLIFTRNALNTPPTLTYLKFLVGGLFTANTTVYVLWLEVGVRGLGIVAKKIPHILSFRDRGWGGRAAKIELSRKPRL